MMPPAPPPPPPPPPDQPNLLGQPDARLAGFKARTAHVGIIGLGYVGLPLSLLFTEAGFRVTGFDIDESKVAQLESGTSYILRISPAEIAAARRAGFTATSDFAHIATQDAILLCVPTPLTAHHEPDLSYIRATAQRIAPWLQPGQLVVLESTTYPGTTEEVLVPLLEAGARDGLRARTRAQTGAQGGTQSGAQGGGQTGAQGGGQTGTQTGAPMAQQDAFYVAFSPEREDPGNTEVARRDTPKVIGGHEPIAAALAAALYGGIFARTVVVSTTRAAEMTKLLENIYRSVNIALVNELKMLAMRMGIDIWEVIEAASTKPFGFQAFQPGPGIGGHCIPVDPFYLTWKAREFDFRTRFIELAGEVNEAMPAFVVQQVARALNTQRKPLNGSRVLVLGVSYKRDIDDLRESPSLTLIELLRAEGAEVAYNDPFHPTVGRGRHYALDMTSTPLEQLPAFDCVLIATDHSAYDYADIVARAQLVVDTRNATRNATPTATGNAASGLTSPTLFRC